MINNIPCNNNVTHEFNEDVLDFLTLLLEEYLRVEKLSKTQSD